MGKLKLIVLLSIQESSKPDNLPRARFYSSWCFVQPRGKKRLPSSSFRYRYRYHDDNNVTVIGNSMTPEAAAGERSQAKLKHQIIHLGQFFGLFFGQRRTKH